MHNSSNPADCTFSYRARTGSVAPPNRPILPHRGLWIPPPLHVQPITAPLMSLPHSIHHGCNPWSSLYNSVPDNGLWMPPPCETPVGSAPELPFYCSLPSAHHMEEANDFIVTKQMHSPQGPVYFIQSEQSAVNPGYMGDHDSTFDERPAAGLSACEEPQVTPLPVELPSTTELKVEPKVAVEQLSTTIKKCFTFMDSAEANAIWEVLAKIGDMLESNTLVLKQLLERLQELQMQVASTQVITPPENKECAYASTIADLDFRVPAYNKSFTRSPDGGSVIAPLACKESEVSTVCVELSSATGVKVMSTDAGKPQCTTIKVQHDSFVSFGVVDSKAPVIDDEGSPTAASASEEPKVMPDAVELPSATEVNMGSQAMGEPESITMKIQQDPFVYAAVDSRAPGSYDERCEESEVTTEQVEQPSDSEKNVEPKGAGEKKSSIMRVQQDQVVSVDVHFRSPSGYDEGLAADLSAFEESLPDMTTVPVDPPSATENMVSKATGEPQSTIKVQRRSYASIVADTTAPADYAIPPLDSSPSTPDLTPVHLQDRLTKDFTSLKQANVTNKTEEAESRMKKICGHASKRDSKEMDTRKLLQRVRSILYNLHRETFEHQMMRLKKLSINSEEKLKGVIELIFEKAIRHQRFSESCARVCLTLNELKAPSSNELADDVMFSALLSHRCQIEFEVKDERVEQKEQELEAASGHRERQRLRMELGETKEKALQRSLGNIRFICELYKVNILHEDTIHSYISSLLNTCSPDSLKQLCRLLYLVGRDLDSESKSRMDSHFAYMKEIIREKRAPRMNCNMLKGLLDLRQNDWVPKRLRAEEEQ